MNYLYLLIGIFGVLIGLLAYYGSVHDKVNALGRFTKPAVGIIVLCGILLIVLSLVS
jgi:hypothetical protein